MLLRSFFKRLCVPSCTLKAAKYTSFYAAPVKACKFALQLPNLHALRSYKVYVTPGAPLERIEVERRVIDVFRAFEKVNKENLALDANFSADLGLDSLDVVEAVIAVEEDFNLEIPDSIADNFRTPLDICDYLNKECGDADIPPQEMDKIKEHRKHHPE